MKLKIVYFGSSLAGKSTNVKNSISDTKVKKPNQR